jgi:plasmid maintenance system killer protein
LEITFDDDDLKQQCNSQRLLVRHQGADRARRIRRRLDDLRAAPTLEAMRNLPGRCHQLGENLDEIFSLDLDHPYRLLFVVANDPIPRMLDGGIDWCKVTGVKILGIKDTHD